MPTAEKIQDGYYRNWVRGVLGLFFLQEGLRDFVDRIVKKHHSNALQSIRQLVDNPAAQCSGCCVSNILPAHATSGTCIQKNGRHCNCRRRANRHCSFCSYMYDEIIQQHRFASPNWETEASLWSTDHWQFAKCFLTTTSKNGDNSALLTDAAGLLSIIINAKFVQNEITCVINAPYDDFCEARLSRNEILHSSNLQLTDIEVANHLQKMITVLEDAKTLAHDPAAKAAVEKIKNIQNDKLIITTESETKAIEVALSAIELKKTECIQELKQKEEESLVAIQSEKDIAVADIDNTLQPEIDHIHQDMAKLNTGIHNIEDRVTKTENAIDTLRNYAADLKLDITKLRTCVTELENRKTKQEKRLIYLHKKQDLKRYLIEQYEDYLTSDISPFIPEEDVHLSKVFVPVKMKRANDAKFHGKTTYTAIDSFDSVIYKDDKLMHNVFVLGDAGTGKTTFCKALICKWCEANSEGNYDQRLVLPSIIKGEGSKASHESETMRGFEFLFYVSLRHTCDERYIEDMIYNQLLKTDQKDFISEIFVTESNKCIVILDGLDEWNPRKSSVRPTLRNDFPKARFNYVKITTSRPYKQDTQADLRILLEGIGKKSVDQLTKSTVSELNKKFQSRMFFWKFQDEVNKMNLNGLCKTPILLKLLVCIWFDEQSLGNSYCGIYSSVINVMIKHANERSIHDEKFQRIKSNLVSNAKPLPLCFDGKEACLEMSSLIASLSKLAFNALFAENRASSLVFKQDEIIKEGLQHEDIEFSKQIGLLSVSQVPGRSVIHRFQCFTFPHKSIQEYLSAVHLSDIISETDPLNEQIKKGFGSRIMLIHNATVLKFLCGINLEKAVQVSKYIAESMGGDQNISYYRKHMQDQPQFNEHYVAQCDPSVTEYQDVLYDCIREGKACGKNKLNFHVSDLDININTKIRTVLNDLDMSSLVTLRIHDDISAIENNFLNTFLRQQCANLRCVVLKNISLTLSQFEKVMLKTVTLKLGHVNFYDVKGHDDSLEDYQFDKVHTKVRELVISNVQLSCVWLTKLLSVVFKASDLRMLDLHCIRCISPCVRQWQTTKDRVAVQEMPMLTQLKLEDNEFPRDILDFFAVLLMYSKQLKNIQLQNIKSNLVCSCMSLHLYKAVNFETLVCTASKQICFRNWQRASQGHVLNPFIFRGSGASFIGNVYISNGRDIVTHCSLIKSEKNVHL